MKIIQYFAMTMMTLLSLFCLASVPGAFVQALFLVIILYGVAGVAAYFGYLIFSTTNLFILSLALSLSPATDINVISDHYNLALISLLSAIFGFTGLILGIKKLKAESS